MRCIFFKFLTFILFTVTYNQIAATNFYIKSTGNDTAKGTSPTQAWKTCNPLYSLTLKPGDSILFKAGDTIYTHFYVAPKDSGTPGSPIYFGSYGKGRAVINADTNWCFFLYNNGGFVFNNLEMMGSSKNDQDGFLYYSDKYAFHTHTFLKLSGLYIHHFGGSGIDLFDYDSSYFGLSDVSISYCILTDNGSCGIKTGDLAGVKSTLYGFKKVHIFYCNALRNLSSAIEIGGVDSGKIEHCLSAYTGKSLSNKGTVGIWAWSSRNVIIQYCISHHVQTAGNDGEGFDLDGGTNHCTIQYCYAYNNAALGFMHCDYAYSRPTRNNTIRYCLSQNDGRKHLKGGCGLYFISWGSGLDSCQIYNNDVYITDNDSSIVSGIAGYILHGYDSGVHIRHCYARNNVIYVDGKNSNRLVDLNGEGRQPIRDTNLAFQGNCYYSANPTSHVWHYENKTYSTLTDFRDSLQQELYKSRPVGDTLDPDFNNPGLAPALNNTDSLIYINAYKFKGSSPLINAGLNLDSLFGTNIGTQDFYGNKPKVVRQDIGMYEYAASTIIAHYHKDLQTAFICPNPANNYTEINLPYYTDKTLVALFTHDGKLIHSQICSGTKCLIDLTGVPAGVYLINVSNLNTQMSASLIKF